MSVLKIPSFREFVIKLTEKAGVTYDYGAIMAYFPVRNWVTTMAMIDKADLYTEEGSDQYGLEDEPHVTLLYGLHDKEIRTNDVRAVLKKYPEFEVKFSKISLFQNEKFDVVKFEAEADILHEINAELKSKFPHTSTFPNYIPHMTIAYVKPGEGQKYVTTLDTPITMKLEYFIYSKAGQENNKLKIAPSKEVVGV
jgi:hypothetical protein